MCIGHYYEQVNRCDVASHLFGCAKFLNADLNEKWREKSLAHSNNDNQAFVHVYLYTLYVRVNVGLKKTVYQNENGKAKYLYTYNLEMAIFRVLEHFALLLLNAHEHTYARTQVFPSSTSDSSIIAHQNIIAKWQQQIRRR